MSDASGELTDCLHPLGVPELRFEAQALGEVVDAGDRHADPLGEVLGGGDVDVVVLSSTVCKATKEIAPTSAVVCRIARRSPRTGSGRLSSAELRVGSEM